MVRKVLACCASGLFATLLLTGCSSGLSASSTCQDFMSASQSEQVSVIDKLAVQYNKPDIATPLGEPDVAYYCASNPSSTLGQFFSQVQG